MITARQWAESVTPPANRALLLLETESRAEIEHGVIQPDSGTRFLLEAVAWLAPLVGFAIFLTPGTRVLEMEPVPPHIALPASAVAYLVAVLGPLLTLSRWKKNGRKRSGLTVGPNVFTLILSILGGVGMVLVAGRAELSLLPWILAPIAALVTAVSALIIQGVSSAPKPTVEERERLDGALLETRNELLSILNRRGLLDNDVYRRAKDSRFGHARFVDK